jgi:hypothetical protein
MLAEHEKEKNLHKLLSNEFNLYENLHQLPSLRSSCSHYEEEIKNSQKIILDELLRVTVNGNNGKIINL